MPHSIALREKPHPASALVRLVEEHVAAHGGGDRTNWFAGITSDTLHRYKRHGSPEASWIDFRADSIESARKAVNELIGLGYSGGTGGPVKRFVCVYAYKKTPNTREILKSDKHHYIPKLILKRFATPPNKSGKAYIYRRQTGKITREPIGEMFQKRDLYSVGEDASLEAAWHKIEQPFAKLCERAAGMEAEYRKGFNQKFQEGDANLAIRAFAMQFIRNVAKLEMAKQVAEAHNEAASAEDVFASVLQDKLPELIAFAKGEVGPGKSNQLLAHLHGKKLTGIPTPTKDVRYILGGCHVLHLAPLGGPKPPSPESTSFVMPVSPTLALALVTAPDVFRPNATPHGLTGEINRLSLELSVEAAAQKKEDLEGVVRQFTNVPLYSLYH